MPYTVADVVFSVISNFFCDQNGYGSNPQATAVISRSVDRHWSASNVTVKTGSVGGAVNVVADGRARAQITSRALRTSSRSRRHGGGGVASPWPVAAVLLLAAAASWRSPETANYSTVPSIR